MSNVNGLVGSGRRRQRVKAMVNGLQPDRLVSGLTAGIVTGLITIILSISFAALIFSGPLEPYFRYGLGIMLVTAVIVGTLCSLLSSYPGTVAIPQDRTAPIFGLIAAVIATRMPGASPESLFHTVIVGIAICTACTGAFLALLGFFNLGNLVRFIPVPVVGGFLAGSGWLLVKGSIMVMVGEPGGWADIPRLFAAERLLGWVPGAFLGLILFLVLRQVRHLLVLPVMLLGATIVFYGLLFYAGISLEEARSRGWLPEPIAQAGLWRPEIFLAFAHVNWSVLLEQVGGFATVFLVSVISILLNASALEFTSRQDIDFNRELWVAGAANMLTGIGGGMVGFHSLSLSSLVHRIGVRGRTAALSSAALCGLALLWGGNFLSFFPIPILGGLLFMLGLTFLVDWLYDGWARLNLPDYLIVVIILGVIGTIGYMQGVGVGIISALLFFVVKYSRIDVVRNALTGRDYHSNVERPTAHHKVLEQKGEQTVILELQGFIFFGTANNLLNRVRARAHDDEREPLRFLVLDFRRVTDIDSSALMSLAKMRDLGRLDGFATILTNVAVSIQRQMKAVGLEHDGSTLLHVTDLDHGVEWCEKEMLREARHAVGPEEFSLQSELAAHCEGVANVSRLLGYFIRQQVPAGTVLLEQGKRAEDLLYIKSGQVAVWLRLDEGRQVRLRAMRAGTVVGEVGLYLGIPRSATVIAAEQCTIYRISATAIRQMQRDQPALAAALHKYMVRVLAERLIHANRALRALVD